ncbi:predicted protein [Micromonas commoda]|uniref:Uncharacterized protein n=1 Tax=Micromonas commoda (strain RCC299 / NOUM17 / CCMP2709) TaxID=296587 RepID=C1E746_MICCC|nr:predicted protein [Micromonas commoda]ACO63544.1 predicted protein [Micromonas commoda]|eukprot:XP_002502286.1 predicted protein [Micromonas commoda]
MARRYLLSQQSLPIVVTYSASTYRARLKLQDDAVATSILGWLCAQVPEVFETHVMPHLTDRDLRSLAFLGGEPRRVIRGSSRAAPALSRWLIPRCLIPRIRPTGCAVVEKDHMRQVLDRFVGFDPDGDAYCRRCRLNGQKRHGKTILKTLLAQHDHAERVAFSPTAGPTSTSSEHRNAHAKMFYAIDAVLRFATSSEARVATCAGGLLSEAASVSSPARAAEEAKEAEDAEAALPMALASFASSGRASPATTNTPAAAIAPLAATEPSRIKTAWSIPGCLMLLMPCCASRLK